MGGGCGGRKKLNNFGKNNKRWEERGKEEEEGETLE